MSFRSNLRVSLADDDVGRYSGSGLTAVGFAQSMNAGDIRGIVTDASGAVLPDVTVTLVNKNTGVTKILTTNQDGLFDTSSIVTGTYEITFSKPGFQTYVRSSLTIDVGNITVNAQLTVGAVTEQVIVNTDVPLLSTENAEQSTTLDARQLSELPQVGQDWQNFTILLPGASGAPMAGGSQGANDPGQVASVNGNLPFSTILADGASVTLPSSANADVMVSGYDSGNESQRVRLLCAVWNWRHYVQPDQQRRYGQIPRRCLRVLAERRAQCSKLCLC